MRSEPGERLPERPGSQLELLAEIEELCVTQFRLTSEAGGPSPHVHRLHADCFLVLEGALRMRLGGEEQVVAPKSWVQVPHGVVHAYALAGEKASFLNVHVPATGFGSYIRGLTGTQDADELRRIRESFDQHPPPEDGGPDGGAALSRLGCGDGEVITDRPGRLLTLLADTEELAVTESLYGPGERGPELHVHHEHVDAWLVLDGALTFELRDGIQFEAGAGTLVVVPPNVAHGFRNAGEVDVHYLNLHAPSSGFGDYVRGRNPSFDQHPPPADGGADPDSVLVRTWS